MRKSDVISLDEKLKLSFAGMGLFDTQREWIHPTTTVDSYEIIFVTEGDVHLFEGDNTYSLKKGDMILLDQGVEHGGSKCSDGHTAFWWLHFRSEGEPLSINKLMRPDYARCEREMKELMHLSKSDMRLCEVNLLRFLLQISTHAERGNKLAYEVDEYVRINARYALSAADVARRFGFSTDYLSRIYKREFGYDLKSGIIKQRLTYAESLLVNTDYTIKEVAQMCAYDDENCFVKFFKYHRGCSPTKFRNSFFYLHMNNK